MQDELGLLARAQALDSQALAQIHDAYYRPIFRYVAFRVDDHQVAEDLTSEVFTRLLTALHRRQLPRRTLEGWLFGVAARVVSDHYRKHYRTRQVGLDESLASTEASPAEVVDIMMIRETLKRAMATLTEDQQHVIALRFGQEMPIREVAQIMGKSEGAVKQLQVRALAMLARKMPAGTMKR